MLLLMMMMAQSGFQATVKNDHPIIAIGLKISCQFFNRQEAKPRPINNRNLHT